MRRVLASYAATLNLETVGIMLKRPSSLSAKAMIRYLFSGIDYIYSKNENVDCLIKSQLWNTCSENTPTHVSSYLQTQPHTCRATYRHSHTPVQLLTDTATHLSSYLQTRPHTVKFLTITPTHCPNKLHIQLYTPTNMLLTHQHTVQINN